MKVSMVNYMCYVKKKQMELCTIISQPLEFLRDRFKRNQSVSQVCGRKRLKPRTGRLYNMKINILQNSAMEDKKHFSRIPTQSIFFKNLSERTLDHQLSEC